MTGRRAAAVAEAAGLVPSCAIGGFTALAAVLSLAGRFLIFGCMISSGIILPRGVHCGDAKRRTMAAR